MKKVSGLSLTLLLASLGYFGAGRANADPLTFTGTFTADNSLFNYSFTTSTSEDFNFYTTSYGGGTNANGTVTAAGGFVPVLTLFSSTGSVIGFGGADGSCSAGMNADAATGLCNDANFSEQLAAGSYDLVLSEFPNIPNGNLSDGFLFSSDPTATGDVCGVAGGTFLEADVAPCVQRTDSFAVNVTSTSAVPEPSTFLLMIPGMAAVAGFARRRLS